MVVWEPRGLSVVEQIERQMAATPDAPAIVSHAGVTSYSGLDVASARLAALLRYYGVGPDRPVAVVADHGAAPIIGLVSVLRAGGVYVPIKPDLPAERIAWMCDEVCPAVVVCTGTPPAAFVDLGVPIVRIDEPATWTEVAPVAARTVPADALAYIIYTSGSTGRPKGVAVTRRGFDAQLRWMQSEFALDATDRLLQLSSTMFDFSIVEMLWLLMVGGAVIASASFDELEPGPLAKLAAEHRATVVNFVPSLLRLVIETNVRWRTIKLVLCGGEALPRELVQDYRRVFPNGQMHNQYGPTETTINATSWRCRADDPTVPIGRAVADTSVYVLDGDLAPVPPGTVGELWIGGIQLARGYLRRPGLTAERFVPDPFALRPNARMYRSGDLVRQRRDATLEYVGRSDHQVNIRGFRIELGEIGAALERHADIEEAVVVVRDGQSGNGQSGKRAARGLHGLR